MYKITGTEGNVLQKSDDGQNVWPKHVVENKNERINFMGCVCGLYC